jgi:hypothetical protein
MNKQTEQEIIMEHVRISALPTNVILYEMSERIERIALALEFIGDYIADSVDEITGDSNE